MQTTRRTFLRTVATGSLGLAAAPSLIIPRRKDQLGVALVGLGNYSQTMLGPALKETRHAYLAGIVTGTPDKARRWSEAYAIPPGNVYDYDTFDRIADNPDIDIVYIVLPNSLHAPFTIRALEAGKHVICEKPMALDAVEAQAMIDAATKARRKLSIGYRLPYDPFHQEVMRFGREKTFGEIHFMVCSLCYRSVSPATSWKMQPAMGGGPLLNLAVYPIQGARYTKGAEPVAVTAQAFTQNPAFADLHETVTWQLDFADGAIAQSMTSSAGYEDRLYAACTEGTFELQPSYNYTGQAGRSPLGAMTFTHVFQQVLQIDDFARCIMDDLPSRVDAQEGLRDMLVLDAIRAAIRSGRRESIG
ncbi:MAG: Gfo/Idh/MocA family oxidoreductase [Bacteroidia bacterium]